MKRPPKKEFHDFLPLTWWDRLFWEYCHGCSLLFKGEQGWKTACCYGHQGGGFSRRYVCGTCDPMEHLS